MATIDKKLIHFQTKSAFNDALANDQLNDWSIVFIKETQEIWTHGQLYSCSEIDLSPYLTKEEAEDIYATKDVATASSDGLMSSSQYTDLQTVKNGIYNLPDYVIGSYSNSNLTYSNGASGAYIKYTNTKKADGSEVQGEVVIPWATDVNGGVILIGHKESAGNYSLQLDKENKAFVSIPTASDSSSGIMSSSDKSKLDGIADNANNYSLPIASASTLGGIKVGSGLEIGEGGVLSATGGGEADSVAWANVTGKPSTFTPSAHTHTASVIGVLTDIEDLPVNRVLVSNENGNMATSVVTSTELGYLDGVTSNIQTQLNAKAASSHTHAASDITSGTLDSARLPIGGTAIGGVKEGATSEKVYGVQIDDEGAMTVNVPWIDTTYSVATTSTNGLMSSADKQKLDSIQTKQIVITIPEESWHGANEFNDITDYLEFETDYTLDNIKNIMSSDTQIIFDCQFDPAYKGQLVVISKTDDLLTGYDIGHSRCYANMLAVGVDSSNDKTNGNIFHIDFSKNESGKYVINIRPTGYCFGDIGELNKYVTAINKYGAVIFDVDKGIDQTFVDFGQYFWFAGKYLEYWDLEEFWDLYIKSRTLFIKENNFLYPVIKKYIITNPQYPSLQSAVFEYNRSEDNKKVTIVLGNFNNKTECKQYVSGNFGVDLHFTADNTILSDSDMIITLSGLPEPLQCFYFDEGSGSATGVAPDYINLICDNQNLIGSEGCPIGQFKCMKTGNMNYTGVAVYNFYLYYAIINLGQTNTVTICRRDVLNQNIIPATTSKDGLMSSEDKAKLDGIVTPTILQAPWVNPTTITSVSATTSDLKQGQIKVFGDGYDMCLVALAGNNRSDRLIYLNWVCNVLSNHGPLNIGINNYIVDVKQEADYNALKNGVISTFQMGYGLVNVFVNDGTTLYGRVTMTADGDGGYSGMKMLGNNLDRLIVFKIKPKEDTQQCYVTIKEIKFIE